MTGVLFTIAAIFVLGAVLILVASLIPASRAAAKELWPFYRSEFLIVGCFLLPAAAGDWVFLALLLAMTLRGQWELFVLFGQKPKTPLGLLALAAGAALVGVGALAPNYLPAALAGSLACLLIMGNIVSGRSWLPAASLVFPALAVALLGVLRQQPQGFLWLLLAQAVVETNDSFALVVGKLIGRTRPFPNLSPRKTLAGLVGGCLAGLVAGLAVARLLPGLSLIAALAAVVTALAAGLAGDLALSGLKRRLGAKDFPPLALLHGGLLDIYDSLLFAAPALLLLRFAAKL